MNDAELIKWIAEHLCSFRPMCGSYAAMDWIDDEGFTHTARINLDDYPEAVTEEVLLRACVNKAINGKSNNNT